MVSQEEVYKELKKYPDGILLTELSEKLTYRRDTNISIKIRKLRLKKLARVESAICNCRGCLRIYPL